MELTKEISTTIDVFLQKKEEILLKIEQRLKNAPENDKITVISPNMFTLNSKDLCGNWSPEFHQFRNQYESIFKILSNTEFEKIGTKLQDIIDKGYIETVKWNWRRQNLHPDVISFLKSL